MREEVGIMEEYNSEYFVKKFEELDPEKAKAAADAMRPILETTIWGDLPVSEIIRLKIDELGPSNWIFDKDFGHFYFGMGTRNWLRENGFGEDFFGVDNLDDYYLGIINLAVGR